MKKFILIIPMACIGAAWCYNIEKITYDKVFIDPLLKPYVKEWCYALEKAGIPWEERLRSIPSITLEYYDKDSRKTGLTYDFSHRVTINRWFIGRNPCALRATVFHELGHAAFDLPHDCCFIMNSRTDTHEQNYCDYWDQLLKDYITECRKHESN